MTQAISDDPTNTTPAAETTPKIRSIKGKKKSKRVRVSRPVRGRDQRPQRSLPSDRVGFPKQMDTLRAFAAASGPSGKTVTNLEVANILSMQPSTVALTNPFFVDNRFLQRVDGGFIPAPEVVSFARTHEWNPDAAPQKLAPLVSTSWFAERLLPRLAFGPLEIEQALVELAEAAAAPPVYRAQVRTLLDYLSTSGLVLREGSTIRAARPQAQAEAADRPASTERPAAAATLEAKEPTSRTAVATSFLQAPTEGVVQFHVNVRVDMAEFAGWSSDRIAAFFTGIAQVLTAKGAIEKSTGS